MEYIKFLLSEEKSLNDFLHYSPKSVINSNSVKYEIIKNFIFLLEICKKSITEFFYNNRYELFDAQVSENLCQIRGYMTLLLSHNKINIKKSIHLEELNKKIYKAIDSLSSFLEELNKNICGRKGGNSKFLKKNNLNFQEFISLLGIDFKLPFWLYYLCVTYFLCQYNLKNEEGVSLAIDYKRLCQDHCLSKTFARSMIHHMQKKISESCSLFIMKMVHADRIRKYYYLSHFLERDDDGRTVLPCYAVMDVILTHICKQNMYLCVVVKRYQKNQYKDSILLVYQSSQDGFRLVHLNERIINMNVLVIEGKVNYDYDYNWESVDAYMKRFNALGILTIIMSNMAKHPQYSGLKLVSHKENPYMPVYRNMLLSEDAIYKKEIESFMSEFDHHKQISIKEGCWKEDYRTFLAMHIYCATVQHLLDKFNKIYKPFMLEEAVC